MHGNFNSPLNRKNSDTTVDVQGWIEWEGNDPAQVTIDVTIAQAGGLSGTGKCGPYVKPAAGKPMMVQWRCDVQENTKKDFVEGWADASADPQAAVPLSGTEVDPGPWQATPLIK